MNIHKLHYFSCLEHLLGEIVVQRLLLYVVSFFKIHLGIECMAKECPVLVTEDFVYEILSQSKLRDNYSKFSFNDLIKVGKATMFLMLF